MHLAIIMDGNGRWATARGLPRAAGHRAGGRAVRRIVEAAASLPIDVLTLYAFSADNWQRPVDEVEALMALFEEYLRGETARCVREGMRVAVIGRRDRLSPGLASSIGRIERLTAAGRRLHLRIAVDYSARDAIWRAACQAQPTNVSDAAARDRFMRAVGSGRGAAVSVPDVDLLIRTGGEQRLSDFLLWECAYAELSFTKTMWPDFDERELRAALDDFAHRDRRFGRVGVYS